MRLFRIIGISLFEIGPPDSSSTRLRDENELKWIHFFFTCANVSLKRKTWGKCKSETWQTSLLPVCPSSDSTWRFWASRTSILAAQPSFERCSSGLMVPKTWGPGTEETAAASLSGSSCSYCETDTLLGSECIPDSGRCEDRNIAGCLWCLWWSWARELI